LSQSPIVLEAEHIRVWFPVRKGILRRTVDHIKAADDISFRLRAGETVGVVGESGFDRVVAVGEYLLIIKSNMAEVAFTVAKDYQGMGLGKLFLHKLANAARENGISGLVAYTAPHNRAMIDLFKTLPYKVKTTFEDEMLCLTCRFDELKDELS